MEINHDNYYSLEARQTYYTASQIKKYLKCPSLWLAIRSGAYSPPETEALLHGKYIDTALTEPEKFDQFCIDNADQIFTKKKDKLTKRFIKTSKIRDIDSAIARVQRDEFFMFYLTGEAQVIIVIEDFHGFPYMCMLDCLSREHGFLTDLKSTRGMYHDEWTELDDGSFAKVSWIHFYRYPMQLALYRDACRIRYGFRPDPYIAAMEKKAVPDFDIIDMYERGPLQGELEKGIYAMQEMDKIKDEDPLSDNVKACRKCEWCLINKKLTKARKHEYDVRLLRF